MDEALLPGAGILGIVVVVVAAVAVMGEAEDEEPATNPSKSLASLKSILR